MGCQHKKNQVTSHLWDDAIILIEKLHAVGWKTLLLVEYPHKKAKMILPKDELLSKGAQRCVQNIYEIFKMMVEGKTIFIYYKLYICIFLYIII
ncbi:hypothetical protein F2P79_025941 [Pimephales promelas]|nr:hypothetical protein F2P79_025941 [Pimephales promelas]